MLHSCELLERLLEDGEDDKEVVHEPVKRADNSKPRLEIPKVVNFEPKEIFDGVMTTREIEEVLYRVDVMNNYIDSDLEVVRKFLDGM